MNPNNIALIIIFNHRFDQNIPRLEELYQKRFSNIYFLVPFYDGTQPNVIPVYANSYYYSTYIAQGLKSFFREEYSHYFFIADDMILNPVVDESNVLELLNITGNDCFIPEIKSMHDIHDWWHMDFAMKFSISDWGIEASKELPSYEEAVKKFAAHQLELKPLSQAQVYQPESMWPRAKRFIKTVSGKESRRKNYYELPYPQVAGVSDILLVSRQAIKRFSHYCGVFGALKLFVELAIPTALALAAESLKFEKGLQLQGRYLWTEDELATLKKYNQKIDHLLSDFPSNYLFIHPVKLSKWEF